MGGGCEGQKKEERDESKGNTFLLFVVDVVIFPLFFSSGVFYRSQFVVFSLLDSLLLTSPSLFLLLFLLLLV